MRVASDSCRTVEAQVPALEMLLIKNGVVSDSSSVLDGLCTTSSSY